MSQTAAKQSFNESLINFYDETLVGHADTIYRFAFALTLSLDGAHQCVRKAYKDIAGKVAAVQKQGDGGVTTMLVAECWQAYNALKNQKFAEGQSAVTRVLKPLSIEARAALVAVDVAGLTAADAARALGWNEKDLRVKLAEARRALMASTLDV